AERILEVAKANPMHYALVRLLRHTSLRAGEILSIRWDRLDLEGGYTVLVGRGGQMRSVYFGQEVAEALKSYREILGDSPPERVFPFTYNSLYNLLRRLAKKAGVEGPFSPRAWRRL
ncbi:MAG TPA: hypothetical protein ENG33_01910, partial [Chloroflexi bacterium]|nr:hypothetical protein [Chloroflexota bacterium]